MAESGNRPAVRILQRRLGRIVIALALAGTFAFGMLWQDSTRFYTHIYRSKYSLLIESSAIELHLLPFERETDKALNFYRGYSDEEKTVYPFPYLDRQTIYIPIYLLILTYLSTLILIWLVLMNRLARRHFKKTTSIPKQD